VKVLVVGGGGREHALTWKIAQSPLVDTIIAAPGNAGIARLARTVPVHPDDVERLAQLALEERCDLTVVGPELPLTLGLADMLGERGLTVFGPTRAAARLEGSKWFAKELMAEMGIPTARAWCVDTRDEAMARANELGFPVVIKADGLAAGKGVVVAADAKEAEGAIDDALAGGRFGRSVERVLIEEHLDGEEASILAFTDGERLAPLAASQDHKRVGDGDTGPNTGGMGAYAPAPIVTPRLLESVMTDVLEPAVRGLLMRHDTVYRGVIYAGLMVTGQGPKVLEFNCRFGDPEAQVTLPLLEGDIVEIMMSVAHGELDPDTVRERDGAAACVVMASGGYPGPYEKGRTIHGLEQVSEMDGVVVFHAGTAERDGTTVTSGGRVVGVTGTGEDLPGALERSYAGVRAVHFEGAHYRRDIGYRAIRRVGQGSRRRRRRRR
jgi:phosphoribosylamine--glycine ligase